MYNVVAWKAFSFVDGFARNFVKLVVIGKGLDGIYLKDTSVKMIRFTMEFGTLVHYDIVGISIHGSSIVCLHTELFERLYVREDL